MTEAKRPPARGRRHPLLWMLVGVTVLLGVAGAGAGYVLYVRPPLVEVLSAPARFSRRGGDFTVNVCGMTSRAMQYGGRGLRYRVNDGPWLPLRQDHVRSHSRDFRIELAHEQLAAGDNLLQLEAEAWGLPPQRLSLPFVYDPSPPSLPQRVGWERPQVEVEEGAWETLKTRGGSRVRPVLGEEGYDRLLVVTGAFAGGRRVSTDAVFRYALPGRPYGFGVVTQWGGRPDEPGTEPRDGWLLSIAWYTTLFNGHGCQFALKHGDGPRTWVKLFRDMQLVAGVRYEIVAEVIEEVDSRGRHVRFRQRSKWWRQGEPEPQRFVELTDDLRPLPPGEYGVALMAYWSQVEFGPVLVEPLAPVVVAR